jgi:hypothetical protein
VPDFAIAIPEDLLAIGLAVLMVGAKLATYSFSLG